MGGFDPSGDDWLEFRGCLDEIVFYGGIGFVLGGLLYWLLRG